MNIEVQINPEDETVWLTQKQMGELFGVKQATLSEHINNIIMSGELDETSIGFSDKSTGGRKPKIYNLDMILSVGYRVNSKCKSVAEFQKLTILLRNQYIRTMHKKGVSGRQINRLTGTSRGMVERILKED